ncbi:YibE/F family protein [Desulfosporosinus sp. PR]|uniref:YibE/F family protein n=1 Tax=Candidatus Desulfosporosinus nitrosoreducens TaxID=3401928 RepID=UPI0027EB2F6C|nr:YibE/F family protein [Desulfosporosinus sp. PR]MDQ7095192.1 YibE/F family protein [Desulfosporosinus sp. PR]
MLKIFFLQDKFKNSGVFVKDGNCLKLNRTVVLVVISLLVALIGLLFISHNEGYYHKTIAKVTALTDQYSLDKQTDNQRIQAVILNGSYKGQEVTLENKAANSQALNLKFKINDEVFVQVQGDINKRAISAEITGFKRDNYIAYVTFIFVVLILSIAGSKGLRSLSSLVINVLIISVVFALYLRGGNLILVSSVASFLFIFTSLFLVGGINRKTFSAILGTILATLMAMLIALVIFKATDGNGIHYEEMEFLTSPPEPIFIAEILIGTLGAIMDIAITMSASIQEMYNRNPHVERKLILNSAREIGKDIMGTMTNTLVFAYFSGSIPMILLWLKNGYPLYEIVNINISLEVIRILTGSIGIVISIPITMYIAMVLLKNHKIGLRS